MKRLLKKLGIMTIVVCIMIASSSIGASAASYKRELGTKKITDKKVDRYGSVGVEINGTMLSDKALLIHDTTYVTLRSFSDALTRAEIEYNRWSRSANVVAQGLVLTATDGAYVVEANGRPLFAMTPVVIMNDGKMA